MQTNKEKYPTARYVKFEKVVREKEEAGYYHIPEACNSPERAYDTIIELTQANRETQEVFGVISLNTKMRVLGCEIIHKGSVNSSIVTPRDVFKQALLKGATSIMVFHNHPSGDSFRSQEDIQVTRRLAEAGKLMGIELIDHIIVGDDEFYSLKDRGDF
ncbi:JAB domain-containing protein [Bacillus sp. MMSF_3328]|uniref:JAB domain-containing protein n=1 Tax=Bacillus sp. MMSF_3328 TaxID=3047080 RepID=UPI00273D8852|nr:JAB domain-containing protein [Bacillus sp. MMSF_3328]